MCRSPTMRGCLWHQPGPRRVARLAGDRRPEVGLCRCAAPNLPRELEPRRPDSEALQVRPAVAPKEMIASDSQTGKSLLPWKSGLLDVRGFGSLGTVRRDAAQFPIIPSAPNLEQRLHRSF